jgi:CRISPR-associated protein Csb2
MLSHGGDDAPDLLHGHARRPHCTFLPLPFVGHTHADGHLLGFALTLPKEISKADRPAVLSALAKLKQIHLPGGCTWRVASAADDPRRTLWRSNWMGPSCYWSTVTPLVLDRFPRLGKPGRRVEDIIARSCQDAGYPVPVEIATHFTSPLRGVPPSWAFRVRRSESDPCRPYTHVTLRFERSMHGPLVLGAGRYFGLGLFQPLKARVSVDDDDGSE